jgi:hypothetical protein
VSYDNTPHIAMSPDGDGVILHLPEFTYLDTQVWSVDIGLTHAALADLRNLLNRAACPHYKGSGYDPDDHGDFDHQAGMTDPSSIGPCPECNGCGITEWVPCSPEWLSAMPSGACNDSPRKPGTTDVSHLHPRL